MILTRRILGPAMIAPSGDGWRNTLKVVTIRDGHAYGVDGYKLVRIALEDCTESINLPAKPLRAVANLMPEPDPRRIPDLGRDPSRHFSASLQEDGRLHIDVQGVEYVLTPQEGVDAASVFVAYTETTPSAVVRLDIYSLKRLVDALIVAGCGEESWIDLEYRGENAGVVIRGEDGDGNPVEGIIMPIHREQHEVARQEKKASGAGRAREGAEARLL